MVEVQIDPSFDYQGVHPSERSIVAAALWALHDLGGDLSGAQPVTQWRSVMEDTYGLDLVGGGISKLARRAAVSGWVRTEGGGGRGKRYSRITLATPLLPPRPIVALCNYPDAGMERVEPPSPPQAPTPTPRAVKSPAERDAQRLADAIEENQRLRKRVADRDETIRAQAANLEGIQKQLIRLSAEKAELERNLKTMIEGEALDDRAWKNLERLMKERPAARAS